MCLKLNSLIFAIAHAQIKIVMLSILVIIVLHNKHKKTDYNHLKQANKSISIYQICIKMMTKNKYNREYQMFGNLRFIMIFDNFLLQN